MSSSVVSPSTFSASKITFSAAKAVEINGKAVGKSAYVNYDGRPLVMQIGPLQSPFGLSTYQDSTPPKYTMDLNLRGYDDPENNPKVATIYNALHALDEYMVEQGVKNSKAWFKGDKSREVVSELYTPSVRFSKDQNGNRKPYPPTIKLQLKQRDGKFETAVWDEKKRPLNDVPLEEVLVKNVVVTALIQCKGVWISTGTNKFNLKWEAVQIRIDKAPESIRGFAFLDEEGDAEAAAIAASYREEEPAAPAPKKPAAAVQNQNVFAALHDDDEDVDDDEALAPPAPAAKKPVAPVAPAPAPAAAEDEDEPEDEPPIPVPAKKPTAVVAKKKLVASVKK